jgi:hypothetical protein
MGRVAPGAVVDALVARGVPLHVAQGVVMNFQDESGLDTGIQEINPTAGRGGYGLAQWTGPRRIALEDFARSRGVPVNDLEAQLDFFMQENAGPEAAAWKQVMAAQNANDAAVAFVNKWERPRSDYAAQRTAKYGGADAVKATSPYGITAKHPGNPTVGTGGYVSPTANKTQPQAKPKTDWAKALSGGLGGFAGAMQSDGSQTQISPSLITPMEAAPMSFVAPSQADENARNQFAALMQSYWMK